MSEFNAFIEPIATSGPVGNLQLQPDWLQADRVGGYSKSEVRADGDQTSLWLAPELLSREIKLLGRRAQLCWWGVVNEVRIVMNGVTFGLSLDNVFNKIAVAYNDIGADGGTIRATTTWASNADSIARFGTKELLYSGGDCTAVAANALRARLLTVMAWPRGLPDIGSGKEDRSYALLLNIGWWQTLAWKYFQRLEGRIEYLGSSETNGIQQAIGWGGTSTQINFKGLTSSYTKTITNATNATPIVITTSTNHACRNGETVTISGVTGNTAANGTYKTRNVTATTFELVDVITGSAIAGSGGYVSGGTMTRTITHSGASKLIWGKAITNATNATPIVITCANHGFVNNSIVYITEVIGNDAANGTFKIGGVTTNTFELYDQYLGTAIAGGSDYAMSGVCSLASSKGLFQSLLSTQIVTIAGSGSNNGSHTVVNNSYSDGKYLDVSSALTTEAAGATVTLSLLGSQTAQSVVIPYSFDVWRTSLRLDKVGSPGDNFVLEIRSDSAGSPGTLIASCTIAGSAISTIAQSYWIYAGTNPTLSGTYWLVATRSGALDLSNYYLVSLDLPVYGTCKAYNGSSWVAQPQSQYMPFRLWAFEDTALQLKRILTDCGQFFTAVDSSITSGIKTNQWRDGDQTALDEATNLIDLGTSTGARYTIFVSEDKVAHIAVETVETEYVDILDVNRQLKYFAGGSRPSEDLPFAEWLALDVAPTHFQELFRLSPIYIDQAEYSVHDDTLRLTPKKL